MKSKVIFVLPIKNSSGISKHQKSVLALTEVDLNCANESKILLLSIDGFYWVVFLLTLFKNFKKNPFNYDSLREISALWSSHESEHFLAQTINLELET